MSPGPIRPYRVYADTSVFGGAFDVEFQGPSTVFFDQCRRSRFRLVVSALVAEELNPAPERVRRLFAEARTYSQYHLVTPEAFELRDAYLKAGIVGKASAADALHVALATVSQCTLLVSWNFRHIVHWQKTVAYEKVNREQGYGSIAICSPAEVITYEKEDV